MVINHYQHRFRRLYSLKVNMVNRKTEMRVSHDPTLIEDSYEIS